MENFNVSTSYTASGCGTWGHAVFYTGEFVNGLPCTCGQMIAVKVKCKSCKTERVEFKKLRKRGK